MSHGSMLQGQINSLFFFHFSGHAFILIQNQKMGAFLSVADNLWAREVALDIPIVPDPTLDIA